MPGACHASGMWSHLSFLSSWMLWMLWTKRDAQYEFSEPLVEGAVGDGGAGCHEEVSFI
jgi:hypothetical protein